MASHSDWNDPQVWDDWTGRRQARPQVAGFNSRVNYLDGRVHADSLSWDGQGGLAHFRRRLTQLGAIPSFTPATDVLIVGCGLGWLIEVILDIGGNNVWGTDTSTLIHSLVADPQVDVRADVQARILDVDVSSPSARQAFKAAGAGDNKGEFNWLVSDHVLEDMVMADIPGFLSDLDTLRSNGPGGVAHVVAAVDTLGQWQLDTSLVTNQLTLAEWAAIDPTHFWVDSHTGQIQGGQ